MNRSRLAPIMVFLLLAVPCPLLWASTALPSRIVSLGPVITEKLYLLGAQESLVGVTTYCRRPAEATKKEKIGNVVEVSTEKILALKPDLVIATSLTDPRAVERLRRLGINVMLVGEPRSFREMNEQFLDLGRIVGRQAEAERIVKVAEAKVKAMRDRLRAATRPAVLVQVGARPLFVATGASFLNDYIEFAGAVNAARDLKAGFVSREEVVRRNPDVIIIVTMGVAAEEERKAWEGLASIRASRERRITAMDPYKVCSPTPVTFVEALDDFIRVIHPNP